jgi:hypothetical protein
MTTAAVAVPGSLLTHAATTTATPAKPASASTSHNPLTSIEHGFEHVMSWITGAGKVALADIIQYTPDAEELATILLPEYKTLETGVGNMVVQGCQLLLTGVINAQQKYASDANATGAQKSSDVLTSVGGTVQSILGLAQVGQASETYVQKLIDAIVAILKVRPAPTTTAAASAPATVVTATKE